MIRAGRGLLLAGLLCVSASRATAAVVARGDAGAPPAAGVTREPEAGGTHLRVDTPLGPVHLFRPAGYDRRTAGLVVYVHGFYTHVDGAWKEHSLARQFSDSRRNALFVVPEAPASADEKPPWPRLGRMIATTLRRARLEPPRGPLVVAGHSGAFRSIVPWLTEPSLKHIILLDALYGNEHDFKEWLKEDRAHRMTLVIRGTAKWADPFVRALPFAVTAPRIPDTVEQFTRPQRTARLLALRSQYGHFELVTEGKVLPVLLGRTSLPAVRRSPTPAP